MKNAKKALVFTAIAVIAFNALLITACSDSPGESGGSEENKFQPPPPIEMPLKAQRWGEPGGWMAHQWESDYLKLSDYTTISPKRGDVLQFKISGTASPELKYVVIQLFQGRNMQDDNSRKFLAGSSGRQNVGTTFTNASFDILITDDINKVDGDIYVQVVNVLWKLDPSGSNLYGDADKLPDSVLDRTIMASISKFTMTVGKKTIEDLTDEERWSYYSNDDSTAELTHFSIANDYTVTATVAGTPELQGEGGVYRAWKVTLQYFYTAKSNTSYIYKFEARTETGTRSMNVQYYEDTVNDVYLGKTIEVTNSWQEFTIKGERIPKAGAEAVRFQLANGIGTVHIKIISITENTDVIKTITVTGIPSDTVIAFLFVSDDEDRVAYSWKEDVNGGTVIFELNDEEDNQPWDGSGSYYLTIHLNNADRWVEYIYTNGQPYNNGPKKYNITSANSTIAFSKFATLPDVFLDDFTPVSPSSLTANTWHNGNITVSGHIDWYSISVTSGTRYYLWWNDSYEGDNTKTLDIDVYALYSSTNIILFDNIVQNDSAWHSPASFTASSTGTVYVRVRGYGGWGTGTYAIVYNTTGIKP